MHILLNVLFALFTAIFVFSVVFRLAEPRKHWVYIIRIWHLFFGSNLIINFCRFFSVIIWCWNVLYVVCLFPIINLCRFFFCHNMMLKSSMCRLLCPKKQMVKFPKKTSIKLSFRVGYPKKRGGNRGRTGGGGGQMHCHGTVLPQNDCNLFVCSCIFFLLYR